jgi:uncharacterized protein (UPF0147 family)
MMVVPAKQLIPREKLPTQDQILDFLAEYTENNNGNYAKPEALPDLPPYLPRYLANTEFTDMMSANLQMDDLDTIRPPRQQNLQRLMLACQIRQYRALGLPPPALYRVFTAVTKYDPRNPELSKGHMIMSTTAVELFKIITSNVDNNDLVEDKAANVGIPIIPALDHANDCECQALYMNNNYESLQPVKMCLPKELTRKYHENPKWPNCYEMGFSAPIHRNFSDVFNSPVSVAGTALPQLIRRQPVAQLYRAKPVLKVPQYSDMKIHENHHLVATIVAQLDRGEIRQFTKYLNEGPMMGLEYDITRFRAFSNKMEFNIDIKSYGMKIISLEDILINEPLVEAFYGRQCCEYCPEQLNVDNETTYMSHLIDKHTALLKGHFTCPACLSPKVFSSRDYSLHYAVAHEGTAPLMNVLNETNIHVRIQHGILLNLFLFTAQKMNFTPDISGEEKYVSTIGGFTLTEPATLALEIMELQLTLIPVGFFRQQRESQRSPDKHSRSPSPTWATVVSKKDKIKRNMEQLPVQDLREKLESRHATVANRQQEEINAIKRLLQDDNVPYYARTNYRPMSMNEYPTLPQEQRVQARVRSYYSQSKKPDTDNQIEGTIDRIHSNKSTEQASASRTMRN